MKKVITLLALGMFAAAPLAGCERNEGVLEETGEDIDQGVDETGEQLEEGVEEGTQE